MITDQIAAKANRCLPAGFKAFAQFPISGANWINEKGDLVAMPSDTIALRVRRDPLGDTMTYVDVLVHEREAQSTDQEFAKRVVEPMVAALEHHK